MAYGGVSQLPDESYAFKASEPRLRSLSPDALDVRRRVWTLGSQVANVPIEVAEVVEPTSGDTAL